MSWCSFCKRLEGETHTDECVQHGGHVCLVAGDCRERPGDHLAERVKAVQARWAKAKAESAE